MDYCKACVRVGVLPKTRHEKAKSIRNHHGILFHAVQAQSFAELKTKRGKQAFSDGFFGIFARFIMLDGKYTEPYSGLTGNLFLKKIVLRVLI